jgi:hypothetical protein
LTLEVVIEDPAIEKVEIFVGDHCSGDCPSGTVPPQLPLMAVDAAYVVPDQVPWSVTADEFHDGVAGFRIESTGDTSMAILVVLGYDAQDQIRWSETFHDVVIPTSDAVRWRVELSPTTPIATTPGAAGTERIARWQQPSRRLPSCLLLEHWESSSTAWRELVVPDADRDCDEVAEANECAPWVPNADGSSPTIADANCLLETSIGMANQLCVLGGPECNENGTPRDACVPVAGPHCMSSVLCGCAGTPDSAACVLAKINDGINTSTIPYLKCVVQLDTDGTSCTDETFEADAGLYLSGTTGSSTKCRGVGFNETQLPLGAFGHYVDIDDSSKLKIEAFDQPCKIDVYFSGASMPQSKLALTALELENGNTLVLPLRIDLKATGCVEPSHCAFFRPVEGVYDSIWQCAGQNLAPRCTPDLANQCSEGPFCNGECCGPGEVCGPNGCTCAGVTRCEGGDTCQSAVVGADQCGTVCCGVMTPCPF